MIARQERHALLGHAVLAAQVAALGHRDAQIGVAAPEPVEQSLSAGGPLQGEAVGGGRLRVHGYGALRRWGERKLHASCITPRRPWEKATMAYEHRLRVRFHDTDPAGIVFFANIFVYCHEAFEEMLRALGLPLDELIRSKEQILPLGHAEADFKKPFRHGALVAVRVVVG